MRINKIPLAVVSTLLLMAFLFFSGNQEAAAAQSDFEANWSIHVDFEGNEVNAELTVEVVEFPPGGGTIHLERTSPLRCRVRDGVTLDNNEATFSGGNGIVCRVPSRRRIIFNMTGGEFIPPSECDCKAGALAESEIVLDANTTGEVRQNAIFTMPDLALRAIMPPVSTLQTLMHFDVDGQVANSEPFIANPGLNTLLAHFAQVNGPNSDDLAYQPFFLANGTALLGFPTDIEEDLALSLRRSRLYIGYSPETEFELLGRMTSLDIDPGCFPTG